MKTKVIGLLAGLALIGAPALAQDTSSSSQSTQSQPSEQTQPSDQSTQLPSTPSDQSGTGGSGTSLPSDQSGTGGSATGSMGEQAQAQEVTGTVVKAERHTVYIQSQGQGAVIPLKVDSKTKFESPGVTRARDLKPGQEIRASFSVKDQTENRAESIQLSGEGGSGSMGTPGTLPGSSPGSTDQGGTTVPESQPPGSTDQGTMGGQGGSGTDTTTPGSSTSPDSTTTPDSTQTPGSSGTDTSGSSGQSTTPPGY